MSGKRTLKQLSLKVLFGWMPHAWELGIRHCLHKVKVRFSGKTRRFPVAGVPVGIIAPVAQAALAEQLQGYLRKAGFESRIFHGSPGNWEGYNYLFIDPHTLGFSSLPQRYVVFQTLDAGQAAWYDEQYERLLQGAEAVLDASLDSIAFLYNRGFRMGKVFYLSLSDGEGMKEFYFMRFLLAQSAISFDAFYRLAGHHIKWTGNRICLGLPESVARYEYFRNTPDYRTFQFFPGLRHSTGWIGCGMSYKFLFTKAKEWDGEYFVIAEDDVEFPAGWEKRLDTALEYIQSPACGRWNVFAGLVAEVNVHARCGKVGRYKGERYVHLNKMVSMVLNVYHKNFFDVLSKWDESDDYMYTNQIDRYIESRRSLSVVVPEPYMVGHLDSLASTLWDKTNGEVYDAYFEKSRKVIKQIADQWESRNGIHDCTPTKHE